MTNPLAQALRDREHDPADEGVIAPAGIGSGDSIQIIRNPAWSEGFHDDDDVWTIAIHNDLASSEAVQYVDRESLIILRDIIDNELKVTG